MNLSGCREKHRVDQVLLDLNHAGQLLLDERRDDAG
jgi:hypothetical protein